MNKINNIKASDKPDSVVSDHLSWHIVANMLMRATFYPAPLEGRSFALAPDRVYPGTAVASRRIK